MKSPSVSVPLRFISSATSSGICTLAAPESTMKYALALPLMVAGRTNTPPMRLNFAVVRANAGSCAAFGLSHALHVAGPDGAVGPWQNFAWASSLEKVSRCSQAPTASIAEAAGLRQAVSLACHRATTCSAFAGGPSEVWACAEPPTAQARKAARNHGLR